MDAVGTGDGDGAQQGPVRMGAVIEDINAVQAVRNAVVVEISRDVTLQGSSLGAYMDVSQAPEGTDILGTQLRYTLVAGSQGFDIWR